MYFLQQAQKVPSVGCNWLISIHVMLLISILFSCNPIGQLCLGGPGYSGHTVNRLNPRAETISEEEHKGFIARRSATERIFNLRILCERYQQHQQDLYHVFVDFKKTFDRVWHEALWSWFTLYSINANLIRVIENLYNKATSAVYVDGEIEDWFRTSSAKKL